MEYGRIVGRLHPCCYLNLRFSLRPGFHPDFTWLGYHSWTIFGLSSAGLTLFALSTVILHSKNQGSLVPDGSGPGWVLALVFIPLGALSAMATEGFTNGRLYLLFVLGIVFASDTCAYFVGRAWGKKKPLPDHLPQQDPGRAVGRASGRRRFGGPGRRYPGRRPHGPAYRTGSGAGRWPPWRLIGDLLVSMIKTTLQGQGLRFHPARPRRSFGSPWTVLSWPGPGSICSGGFGGRM